MTPEFLGLLGASTIYVNNGTQSCPLQTQILNHYKSASVLFPLWRLWLCTLTVILPTLFTCIGLLVTILFNCTTNKLPHVLSRLFIYLKFTRNCTCIGSVDIHFQFKTFLLNHSINNTVHILSGGQLVFIFWNSTRITCWRPESLTMDVGRPPLTIQWTILFVTSVWSLALSGLLCPNTIQIGLMMFVPSFLLVHQHSSKTTYCISLDVYAADVFEPQKTKTFSQWKQCTFSISITLLSSSLKAKWSQFTINRFITFHLELTIFDIKTWYQNKFSGSTQCRHCFSKQYNKLIEI